MLKLHRVNYDYSKEGLEFTKKNVDFSKEGLIIRKTLVRASQAKSSIYGDILTPLSPNPYFLGT